MTATPDPDVRELAARMLADEFCDEAYYVSWEKLPERNRDFFRHFADRFLSAVAPVIRREERATVADGLALIAGDPVRLALWLDLHDVKPTAGPGVVLAAVAAAIARSHANQEEADRG